MWIDPPKRRGRSCRKASRARTSRRRGGVAESLNRNQRTNFITSFVTTAPKLPDFIDPAASFSEGILRSPLGAPFVMFFAEIPAEPCAAMKNNTFSTEWPHKSGKMRKFPEIDRAGWFKLGMARSNILTRSYLITDLCGSRLQPRHSEPRKTRALALKAYRVWRPAIYEMASSQSGLLEQLAQTLAWHG